MSKQKLCFQKHDGKIRFFSLTEMNICFDYDSCSIEFGGVDALKSSEVPHISNPHKISLGGLYIARGSLSSFLRWVILPHCTLDPGPSQALGGIIKRKEHPQFFMDPCQDLLNFDELPTKKKCQSDGASNGWISVESRVYLDLVNSSGFWSEFNLDPMLGVEKSQAQMGTI